MSHGFSNYWSGDNGLGAAMTQAAARDTAEDAGRAVRRLEARVALLERFIIRWAECDLGVTPFPRDEAQQMLNEIRR